MTFSIGSGPRSSLYKVDAIVLRHRPLGEADRLLTLYTQEIGKLIVVARGIRRIKSKVTGHLQPFSHVSLLLVRGFNLDIVTQAEVQNAFPSIRSDIEKAGRAWYAAELIDRFSQVRDPDPQIFELLLETLHLIDKRARIDETLRRFEVRLIGKIGYQTELFQCVSCRDPLLPVDSFAFSIEEGGTVCSRCHHLSGVVRIVSLDALKVLRLLQSGDDETLARLRWSSQLSAEVDGFLRWVEIYLLEGVPRSAEFLDSLRRPSISRLSD